MNKVMELLGTLMNFLGGGNAMMILTLIIDAVREAEKAYTGAKQGVYKKNAVMEVIDDAIEGIDVFRDGTSEYKAMIKGVISEIVDAVVAAFNLTGLWGKDVTINWEGGKL